jgi:hypothetical protein
MSGVQSRLCAGLPGWLRGGGRRVGDGLARSGIRDGLMDL